MRSLSNRLEKVEWQVKEKHMRMDIDRWRARSKEGSRATKETIQLGELLHIERDDNNTLRVRRAGVSPFS